MILNLKTKILSLCFGFIGFTHVAFAQSDLSFYHLGELTPQNNIFNPVFFPDADFYVSLPLISGVSTNLNNSFTYNDLFVAIDGTDSVQFDTEHLLSNINDGDRLSFDGSISLLQVGFHVGKAGAVQLFANERVKSRLFYPKKLLQYLLEGNADFLGQNVSENNLRGQGSYYREYGVGYSHELSVLGEKKLRVGLKLKYLQGFIQAEVDKEAAVSFLTDPDTYYVNISTNNSVLRTAGLDSFDNSDYLMSNGNNGFGFDFGADMQITPKLNVAFSVNDIGSINWREGIKNYELVESEATFGGMDLRDLDNAGDVLKDTLEQLFDYREFEDEEFKSKLNTRVFISGSYKVIPKGTVTATVMSRNDLGDASFTYGLGYTHYVGKMLTVSGSISKKPKQGVALGGAVGARFGIIQLYTSLDNTIGINDIRNMNNLNVRFGVNLLFGRRSEKKEKDSQEKIKSEKSKPQKEKFGPFPDEYDLGHLNDSEN
ncbi:DUF5723 family protein [Reichenbachiella sp.]|uniref:DUF5723 family protein n=1 Tax=Reichenbachiella sp. TaxID=2184521 RepID=UPI003B5CEEC7